MRKLLTSARVAALAATAIMACSHDKITVPCTLLGCESGLTVHLASLPTGPFRIDITPSGAPGVVYSFQCSSTTGCAQDVFFTGLVADRFTVVVTVGSATRSTDIAATYVHYQPNGPNCPPDCLMATVTASVPT